MFWLYFIRRRKATRMNNFKRRQYERRMTSTSNGHTTAARLSTTMIAIVLCTRIGSAQPSKTWCGTELHRTTLPRWPCCGPLAVTTELPSLPALTLLRRVGCHITSSYVVFIFRQRANVKSRSYIILEIKIILLLSQQERGLFNMKQKLNLL